MKLILFILSFVSVSVNAQDSCITKLDSLQFSIRELQREVKYLRIQNAMEQDVFNCITLDQNANVIIDRKPFNTAFRRLNYWRMRDEKRAD